LRRSNLELRRKLSDGDDARRDQWLRGDQVAVTGDEKVRAARDCGR
jgi:hypothetical protein